MEQSLNLWELLQGILSRKRLMFAVFVLVVGVVAAVVMTAKSKYTPSLQIIVEADNNPYTRIDQNQQREQISEQEVASQVQVLMSHDLAGRVSERLNLAQYPQFDPLMEGVSLKKRVLIMLGIAEDPRDQTVEQRVLESYFKNIKVYQIETSRVITVEFTSTDPQIAADVANAVGETYVIATREVKYETANSALQWLSAEIARLRQKVAESEAAVEEFRAAKGLFRTQQESLSGQELSGINGQIVLAAAARSEAQARADAIRRQLEETGTVENSRDVLNSTVVQRLREQQVTLQRQVADLSSTYLSSHPRMVRLQNEIDNLNRQVRAEALKIVAALEQEARVQGTREASLRASLAELKTAESTANQDEITLRALEREAAANRGLLQTFMQRFSEASARQDVFALPAGARIISRAQVLGRPSFPRRAPMLFLGVAAAIALALLSGFVAEVFRPSVGSARSAAAIPVRREPRIAEPATAVAATGAMETGAAATMAPLVTEPQLHAERQLAPEPEPAVPARELGPVLQEFPPIAAEGKDVFDVASESVRDPTTDLSVAVRRLSQKLEDERRSGGSKLTMWTSSPDAAEDRAVIVANLARSLALAGTKTVVLDADFTSQDLSQAFRLENGPGLADLISGNASFAEAIAKDQLSGVHVLRRGSGGAAARELLEHQRVGYILDALDHAYDVVLVNSGAITNTHGLGLATKVPFALIVAHATRDGERAGAAVQQTLDTLGVGKVAAVMVQAGGGLFGKLMGRGRKAA